MNEKHARKGAQKDADEHQVPIALVNAPIEHAEDEDGPFGWCPAEAVSMLYPHGKVIETLQPNPNAPFVMREEPDKPELKRFSLCYAFDESRYADFALEAESEEDALRIANAMLSHGIIPDELEWRATDCDSGADNHRMFANDGHGEEHCAHLPTFEELAEESGTELPPNWRELQPKPPELTREQKLANVLQCLVNAYAAGSWEGMALAAEAAQTLGINIPEEVEA